MSPDRLVTEYGAIKSIVVITRIHEGNILTTEAHDAMRVSHRRMAMAIAPDDSEVLACRRGRPSRTGVGTSGRDASRRPQVNIARDDDLTCNGRAPDHVESSVTECQL